MKTIINPEVLESAFGDQILSYLQTLGVAAEARSQNVDGTISWQRSLNQTLTKQLGEVSKQNLCYKLPSNIFAYLNSLH